MPHSSFLVHVCSDVECGKPSVKHYTIPAYDADDANKQAKNKFSKETGKEPTLSWARKK